MAATADAETISPIDPRRQTLANPRFLCRGQRLGLPQIKAKDHLGLTSIDVLPPGTAGGRRLKLQLVVGN